MSQDVADEREARPRMPRWAKVGAILALIAVVLLVVMLIAGGGQHGPGRHGVGAGAGDRQQRQPGGDRAPERGAHTPPRGGRE